MKKMCNQFEGSRSHILVAVVRVFYVIEDLLLAPLVDELGNEFVLPNGTGVPFPLAFFVPGGPAGTSAISASVGECSSVCSEPSSSPSPPGDKGSLYASRWIFISTFMLYFIFEYNVNDFL